MTKSSNKTQIAIDKSTNLVYNTDMTNNNNNTRKVNTMSNLNKLMNHFMAKGHSWSNSFQLAKEVLRRCK